MTAFWTWLVNYFSKGKLTCCQLAPKQQGNGQPPAIMTRILGILPRPGPTSWWGSRWYPLKHISIPLNLPPVRLEICLGKLSSSRRDRWIPANGPVWLNAEIHRACDNLSNFPFDTYIIDQIWFLFPFFSRSSYESKLTSNTMLLIAGWINTPNIAEMEIHARCNMHCGYSFYTRTNLRGTVPIAASQRAWRCRLWISSPD